MAMEWRKLLERRERRRLKACEAGERRGDTLFYTHCSGGAEMTTTKAKSLTVVLVVGGLGRRRRGEEENSVCRKEGERERGLKEEEREIGEGGTKEKIQDHPNQENPQSPGRNIYLKHHFRTCVLDPSRIASPSTVREASFLPFLCRRRNITDQRQEFSSAQYFFEERLRISLPR